MYKHKGMQKATLLWGSAEVKNDNELSKINKLFEAEAERFSDNMNTIDEKKYTTLKKIGSKRHPSGKEMSERDIAAANSFLTKVFARQEREKVRHSSKIEKLMDRKTYWASQPGKYSFILETV